MATYKKLSRFVLSRGLVLSVLLLWGAVALSLRAGQGGQGAALYYQSAQAFQTAALVAFGCGTIGSVLVEDMLRYFGE